MKHTNDLGKDPIFPLVLRLAIPTMLAQFVSVLYSIVDRMYIGAGVGDLALAGVGVCAPIVTLLSSFASLIGLGGSPIMAMRMGAGDKREAQKILNNSFFMLLLGDVSASDLWFSGPKRKISDVVWRESGHISLCEYLCDHLYDGNRICVVIHGHEQLSDCPGLFRPGYGDRHAGSRAQYRSRIRSSSSAFIWEWPARLWRL